MTAPVRTTCPYCGVGCGILATPDGRGEVAIAGDPEHPANFGRLCSKGSALGQTVSLDGRLLTPRIHGEPASWDAALDLIAASIRSAIDSRGPESVAIYGSGQLLTEAASQGIVPSFQHCHCRRPTISADDIVEQLGKRRFVPSREQCLTRSAQTVCERRSSHTSVLTLILHQRIGLELLQVMPNGVQRCP